ncbi:group I intron endonuclease [Bacillus sp. OV194]|nr:group I intron endonuclease [Bacillus sp. OV194]
MSKTGIYQIKNRKNGKVYIGQALNIELRLIQHFKQLKAGKHKNHKLQSDFSSFGEEGFETRILEECKPWELTRREGTLCHEHDVWNEEKGYNLGRLLDYRRLSEKDAIRYKDLILNYINAGYRKAFYKARDFSVDFDKKKGFFGLDKEQIAIAMREISDEDYKKYRCFITWEPLSASLSFHPYDKSYATLDFAIIKLEEKISCEQFEKLDFFQKHHFESTKGLPEDSDILLAKQRHNLSKLLALAGLNQDYQRFLLEEFTEQEPTKEIGAIDIGLADLLESAIEPFLYEDDGESGHEFVIYVRSHPLFDTIRNI